MFSPHFSDDEGTENKNEMSLCSPQKIEEVQIVPDQPELESDSENDIFADNTVGNLDAAVAANEQFGRKIKATKKAQMISQDDDEENEDDEDDQSDDQILEQKD